MQKQDKDFFNDICHAIQMGNFLCTTYSSNNNYLLKYHNTYNSLQTS